MHVEQHAYRDIFSITYFLHIDGNDAMKTLLSNWKHSDTRAIEIHYVYPCLLKLADKMTRER